jgi:hypothetical protein
LAHKAIELILFISAKIKDIFELGRKYPWPRPEICLRCNESKVWGHGFTTAYFDGFDSAVILKRYRCPVCGCIIRLRPKGYFHRFQASIETIRSKLSHRLKKGRWPPGLSRSRQAHWLRALRRKAEAYLTQSFKGTLIEAFDHLLFQGKIPVSRSI